MDYIDENKEHEFFYICGHGSTILDANNNDIQIEMQDNVIFTFAPPGATCSLPPETLEQLRKKLYETKDEYYDTKTFWNQVLKSEFEIRGMNYCSKEWVGFFAEKNGYSSTKACNIQYNTITQKSFTFEDETLPFGVWNLRTNENYLDYIDEEHHNLYFICEFLKKLFPNKIINILDLTCNSALLFDKSAYDESSRMQRRLARTATSVDVKELYRPSVRKNRNTKVYKTNKKKVSKTKKLKSARKPVRRYKNRSKSNSKSTSV